MILPEVASIFRKYRYSRVGAVADYTRECNAAPRINNAQSEMVGSTSGIGMALAIHHGEAPAAGDQQAAAASLSKQEIALLLGRRYGLTTDLEVCTPSTGGFFHCVDGHQFNLRARLMYRRPPDFSDGGPIHFSTAAESSEELFAELNATGEKFDLVFVDPWHTYAASLRDIVYALQLVRHDGLVLVHDCSPPSAEMAVPLFQPGDWCGVTFAAFLDVVLFNHGVHFATVDSDYGCGIISKVPRPELFGSNWNPTLAWRWKTLGLDGKYSYLDKHRTELLHLMSCDVFRRRQAA